MVSYLVIAVLEVLSRSLVPPTHPKSPAVNEEGNTTPVLPAVIVLEYQALIVFTSNLLLYKTSSSCTPPKSHTSALAIVTLFGIISSNGKYKSVPGATSLKRKVLGPPIYANSKVSTRSTTTLVAFVPKSPVEVAVPSICNEEYCDPRNRTVQLPVTAISI